MTLFRFLIAAFLFSFLCSPCFADFFPDYEEDNPLPNRSERIRRFVRVMSRKPDPDALPETGIGFRGHLKNVLRGGTLSLEFQVPKRLHKQFRSWAEAVGPAGKEDFEMVGREDPDYRNILNPRTKKEDP